MLIRCPIHGFAGVCIYSPALLELQRDGTVPEIVTVELRDPPEEIAFFRFNITPAEAAKIPIANGAIPFDLASCEIMAQFPEMCGFCFQEQRAVLQAQASVAR